MAAKKASTKKKATAKKATTEDAAVATVADDEAEGMQWNLKWQHLNTLSSLSSLSLEDACLYL